MLKGDGSLVNASLCYRIHYTRLMHKNNAELVLVCIFFLIILGSVCCVCLSPLCFLLFCQLPLPSLLLLLSPVYDPQTRFPFCVSIIKFNLEHWKMLLWCFCFFFKELFIEWTVCYGVPQFFQCSIPTKMGLYPRTLPFSLYINLNLNFSQDFAQKALLDKFI